MSILPSIIWVNRFRTDICEAKSFVICDYIQFHYFNLNRLGGLTLTLLVYHEMDT